jgi:hypothetical protein
MTAGLHQRRAGRSNSPGLEKGPEGPFSFATGLVRHLCREEPDVPDPDPVEPVDPEVPVDPAACWEPDMDEERFSS